MSKENNYTGVQATYFTTDKKGREQAHSSSPHRVGETWNGVGRWVDLRPGTIELIKGEPHTWEDGIFETLWTPQSYC